MIHIYPNAQLVYFGGHFFLTISIAVNVPISFSKSNKVLTCLKAFSNRFNSSKNHPTMTHFTVDSVLPANVYNRLLIDNDAVEQATLRELKSLYVPALAKILAAHEVSDYVELHLLHRHFILKDGEAMVHKPFVTSDSGDKSITVDIAKAVPCPSFAKPSLFPLMWMASSTGRLVAYEYGTLGNGSPQPRKIKNISQETWDAFAQDFCGYINVVGIEDIISLKDKSCVTGGEYVVPHLRVIFRIPYSIINLQAPSGLIETS